MAKRLLYFHRHLLVFFLFTLFISIVYFNALNSSWHMDDEPNILNNYHLHLTSLKIDSLLNTFFTNPNNPYELGSDLYRPVPCLSFAINWYFGKDNVIGYHIFDIIIHILTAVFLFLFIYRLFDTPNIKNNYKNAFYIAFFSTLLWALNPIQIQAVTYIVQRMAQLAALFYIMAMYAYIKARLTAFLKYKILWIVMLCCCFLLGVGSKENAAMLPISIILIEIIFFQDITKHLVQKKMFIWGGISISLVIFWGIFIVLNGNPLSFLQGYEHRSFSFSERLLAQPRIVIFYLSQIFFPLPSRFSIAHDVTLSDSIFFPWTTLVSILAIIFLTAFAVFRIRKFPLISFSILFFFLNHLIESSVFPLELVFEHRNYLPSFFCFLPLALLVVKTFHYFKDQRKSLAAVVACLAVILVILSGLFTHIRNRAWENGVTLWSDAAVKAPNNARAHSTLAIKLAWGSNSNHPSRYDMALQLFEKSLDMHFPTKSHRAEIIGNMASIYSNNKKDYPEAITLFKKALPINPNNLKIRKDYVHTLILNNDLPEALENIELLLSKNKKNKDYHNLKGFVLLWQKEYEQAMVSFKEALRLGPPNPALLLNIGAGLKLQQAYEKAEFFFLEMIESSPENIAPYFFLIDNYLKAGRIKEACKSAWKIVDEFDKNWILNELETLEELRYPPLSKSDIREFLKQELYSKELNDDKADNFKTD